MILNPVRQPFCDLLWKKRAQGFIHPAVIFIQPFQSIFTKEFRYYCRGVDMTAGEGFEREPVAEFRSTGFATQDDILMSDSVTTLTIESGLVRGHHSRKKRLSIEILPYILRSLVNTEPIAYAMACSMTEIPTCSP